MNEDDEFEDLIEQFAEGWNSWQDLVNDNLKDLSDEDLKSFMSKYSVNEKQVGFRREIAALAIGEEWRRYHFRKAEELNADCYCLWHQCDSKNCPNDGAHD